MNLVLDIGNSRVKCAVFEKNKCIEKAIWETLSLETLKEKCAAYQIKNAIVYASGIEPEDVKNYLDAHFKVIRLTHETPIPIKNNYATPETLGKDRLAGVIAAHFLFPTQACLVVDAGSALTFNFLDAAACFQGGSISPGLKMRYKALNHFTARLPLLNFVNTISDEIIGRDTISAMTIGVQQGFVSEVEGLVKKYKKKYGAFQLILTGGDGTFLNDNIKIKNKYYERDLVLIGLNRIINSIDN